MFAVVKTGGKQYTVREKDVLRVEKLDAKKGDKVKLDQVLMVGEGKSVKIGSPLVSGAAVTAEVVEQTRNGKIIVYKKKRRQGYERTKGHQQQVTVLKVTGISGAGTKAQKTEKSGDK